jgi:hypothetical protein
MAAPLRFILVMAVAQRGFWRVHGLHFERDWRALQLGDELVLEPDGGGIPMIDARTKAQIDADVKIGALAVKEASAEEVETYLKQIEELRGQDKDQVISDLQKKNNDLEARLMKLELLASGGGVGGGGGKKADKPADAPKG